MQGEGRAVRVALDPGGTGGRENFHMHAVQV